MKRLMIAATMLMTAMVSGAFAQGMSGTLRSTTGATVSVDQLKGRVVVMLFGGIVDPQSPDELPMLQRIADRYAGKGVVVYWVSTDPTSATDAQLTAYASQNGFKGAILRDSGDVLRSIGAGRRTQLPTTVVIDTNGAIAGRPIGGFDRDVDLVGKVAVIVDALMK